MKLPNKVGDNTIESLDLKKNNIKIIENFRGKIKMKWNKIKITKFYTNSATYTLCCNILLKAIFFYFAKLNAKGFIRWGCLGE